jgi:hypothetical protein
MKVEIFTVCEFATAEPATGKLTIVGTFDHLVGAQPPVVFPFCVVAIRMRFELVEAGMKKIRLSFIDADGKPVLPTIEVPLNVQVAQGETTTTVPFVLTMQPLQLPHFGEYSIDLAVDGNHSSSIPLIVKQVQPPQTPQLPGFLPPPQ